MEILTKLGFSDKETAVYLAVLRHGKVSPSTVARLTKLKRTTAYSVAEELIKRGVITVDLASKTKSLIALPPEEIGQMVAKEEKALEAKRALIPDAVKELREFAQGNKYVLPKVTFIGEEELEAYLYRQTPAWNASLLRTDLIWWGYQSTSFVEKYQAYIDWYWREASKPGISLSLISNDSEIEKMMAKRNFTERRIRFWGEHADFSATTWVCGDHLIMIQTDKKPYFLIEIIDATLAHNQREVFKGIWRGLDS